MRKIAIITAVFGLLFLSATAFAKPMMGHGKGPGGAGPLGIAMALNNPAIIKEAGLPEETLEKAKALRSRHREQMIDARGKIDKAQAALDDAIAGKEFNEKSIREKSADLIKAKTDMMNVKTDHMIEMRKIFTEEQYEKLLKAIQKFQAKAGPRQGPGPRHWIDDPDDAE